jgi:hypothetical protein
VFADAAKGHANRIFTKNRNSGLHNHTPFKSDAYQKVTANSGALCFAHFDWGHTPRAIRGQHLEAIIFLNLSDKKHPATAPPPLRDEK